jgi:Mg/Co/Ni transporter MgtE
MNRDVLSVKPNLSVNELLDTYFNVYRKSEFPVIGEHQNLIGAVTVKEAMNVS